MALTKILPKLYEKFPLGRTRQPVVEWLYLRMLFAYKRWIEDPYAALTRRRPDLFRGGHVLDIGANVGYTARVFARAIDPSYSVFAFEPEPLNVQRMKSIVRRAPVEIVQAAVGDKPGKAHLLINPLHPGDHRITTSDAGVEVEMITVDDFIERRAISPVRFVKIDVQGFELPVSRGMSRLLEKAASISVAFEYSGESRELLDFYRDRGFALHLLAHTGQLLDLADLDRVMRERGYTDILASR